MSMHPAVVNLLIVTRNGTDFTDFPHDSADVLYAARKVAFQHACKTLHQYLDAKDPSSLDRDQMLAELHHTANELLQSFTAHSVTELHSLSKSS